MKSYMRRFANPIEKNAPCYMQSRVRPRDRGWTGNNCRPMRGPRAAIVIAVALSPAAATADGQLGLNKLEAGVARDHSAMSHVTPEQHEAAMTDAAAMPSSTARSASATRGAPLATRVRATLHQNGAKRVANLRGGSSPGTTPAAGPSTSPAGPGGCIPTIRVGPATSTSRT